MGGSSFLALMIFLVRVSCPISRHPLPPLCHHPYPILTPSILSTFPRWNLTFPTCVPPSLPPPSPPVPPSQQGFAEVQGYSKNSEGLEEDLAADSTRPLLVGDASRDGKGSVGASVALSDSTSHRDGAGNGDGKGEGDFRAASSFPWEEIAAGADVASRDTQSGDKQVIDMLSEDKALSPIKGDQGIVDRSAAVMSTPFRAVARGLLGVTGRAVRSFPTMHKRFKEDSAAAFRTAARIDDVCGLVLFSGYVVAMIVIFTVY